MDGPGSRTWERVLNCTVRTIYTASGWMAPRRLVVAKRQEEQVVGVGR
jgi:hypothetical protein